MDLFEAVSHALDGHRTEVVTWAGKNGPLTEEVRTFEPETWVAHILKRGRVTPVQCLALVLFAVREDFNPASERRIVESWAGELRKAAANGEIEPRDALSLLPLGAVPEGWDWLLSLDDADKFVAARGMGWTCTERAEWMRGQFTAIDDAAAAEPLPTAIEAGTPKIWTPERLDELRAYRDKHGTKKAAAWAGVSESRVRILLPGDKPQGKGYSAFNPRTK